MKATIWLSATMGFFFGLVFFIIIAIIDDIAVALLVGLLTGILFGGVLAIYMTIHNSITSKKYLSYKTDNITEKVIYEADIFRLNGNKNDAGHLYLTETTLITVMIKNKTVLTEMKIPLNSIDKIMQKHDYGHLINALIIQKDGTETRFISDYIKFANSVRPIIGDDVFISLSVQTPMMTQKLELLDKQHAYLKKYVSQLESPSKDFQTFLTDYFTGHPMIRGRGEEDDTVWIRLNGKEREIAIQMILDNLGHDSAYIRAIGWFKDERAILMLEKLVDTLPKKYCYEKLLAARILYDWVGYEKYCSVLAEILPTSGEYTKTSLKFWITGFEKEIAIHYIFMLLEDKSSLVRWCAYGALLDYFKLGAQKYDDTKFYTDETVYADKPLFQERLSSLKEKAKSL